MIRSADSGETWLSYVSPLALPRLVSPHFEAAPACETVQGVVALIDVERFSSFAERMAERGGQGIEQLSVRINQTFARVVDAIGRCGGIAHGFPGDSVIAFWPADVDLAGVALSAGRCVLDLLDAHRDDELPLKAGLAAGQVRLGHVGGNAGRFHVLLSGEPLDQMGKAETRATRGKLIVSQPAWDLLCEHAEGRVVTDGFYELQSLRPAPRTDVPAQTAASTGEAVVERARAYLPLALVRQLEAGHADWLGEFRDITAVFVRIAPADASFGAVQDSFAEVQRVVFLHGGDITRFAHDDKGLIVLAAFGLPPLSSEAAAARAVHSCLEMQRSAAAAGFSLSIGVATGRVFCGTLGAPQRREYSLVGSTANLAARLMQTAAAGTQCDAATAGLAGGVCRFESGGAVTPKGSARPIEIFRLLSGKPDAAPAPDAGAAPRLVGRQRERDALHAWIDSATRGPGAIASVSGEAGIGKSELIREAAAYARERGIEVLAVACEAVQVSSSYAAWSGVLSALLDLPAAAETGQKAERLLKAVEEAGVARDFAPLLAPLLGLPLEENATTRDMSGAARGETLLATLSRLLTNLSAARRANGTSVFIVLEDVHWMDPASWDLLSMLARDPADAALALLVTVRAESLAPGPHHAIFEEARVQRIALLPLTPQETAELARRLLHAGEVSPQLAELVWERTRGNPFFCEQLLSALAESGVVGVESGIADLRMRGAARDESIVPRSVAAVLTSRLDRLPAPVQLTLKAPSIAGAQVRLDMLAAIHPMKLDQQSLLDHLSTAVEVGLVDGDELQPTRRFCHAITRDVAYGTLLVSQRHQLHRAAAEFLDHAGDGPASAAVQFYHWRRSDDAARALDYVDRAGADAMRNGDYHSAAEMYEYALETLAQSGWPTGATGRAGGSHGQLPREAVWAGQLGQAQVATGMHVEARESLQRCLALLLDPSPRGSLRLGAGILREALRQLVHRALAGRIEGSRAGDAARLELAAEAFEQLGYVYYASGQTLYGLYASLRILNLSELAGSPGRLARALAVMSLTASVVGLRALGRLYDRRALAMARDSEDLRAQAFVGWVAGVRAAGEASWSLLEARVEEALHAAEQAGERRLAIMSLQTLSWPAYVRGDFVRCGQIAGAQLAIARESKNRLWEAWGLNTLSEACMMTSDFDAAVRHSRRCLDVLAHESDRTEEIRALGVLSVSLLRLARSEDAMLEARKALDLMQGIEMTYFGMIEGFAGVAEVMIAACENARAADGVVSRESKRDTRRAVAALARFCRVFPIGRPRLAVLRARLAMLHRSPAAAARQLRRAVAAAETFGMPVEKVRAQATATQMQTGNSDGRAAVAVSAPGKHRSHEQANAVSGELVE